ncbi:MAG: type II secretion system minor pseudopilin GspI [Gallionellaceae bacterium]|nr:type II secretion system minor pseudopilin GspI [Gallionellaceae bacterium]
MQRAGGFTLLEVLIALAIVAIGLTAALRASGAGSNGALEYRSHLLALWLAENVAAERTARGDWPEPGVREHDEEMAGYRFLVREEVKTTPNPRFRRLEVAVADVTEPGRQLRRIVAFLVEPDR